ncbi:MAG: hypothetical protein HN350_17975 [Phycisphaerales bacterium]|jgi:hypothetical protein|nr:hypothetical protein [Phycisphaerales bacterium]
MHDTKNTIVLIIFAGLLGGCAQDIGSRQLLRTAGAGEFGSSQFACEDTVSVAKNAGYDYEKLVSGCLKRNPAALHSIFLLTKNAGFDAASAQGNAAVLGMLLRRLGDDFVGRGLQKEPQDIQNAVHENLLYDFGWGNDDSITIPILKEWYPRAFDTLTD